MSACLFTMGAAWFQNTPLNEIEEQEKRWIEAVDRIDNGTDDSGNKFFMDRYAGYSDNLRGLWFFRAGLNHMKKDNGT